jgi:hypothetical protein
MKNLLLSGLVLSTLGAYGQVKPSDAVRAVEQQVTAYNARDIEAFLASYSDSVRLYTFPDKLVGRGKQVMRQRYVSLFSKAPKLHCQIIGRLIEGNTIIDQERITGLGSKALTGVAIYQVEDGKISKVYFVN